MSDEKEKAQYAKAFALINRIAEKELGWQVPKRKRAAQYLPCIVILDSKASRPLSPQGANRKMAEGYRNKQRVQLLDRITGRVIG
jgi:hypothetical protein